MILVQFGKHNKVFLLAVCNFIPDSLIHYDIFLQHAEVKHYGVTHDLKEDHTSLTGCPKAAKFVMIILLVRSDHLVSVVKAIPKKLDAKLKS